MKKYVNEVLCCFILISCLGLYVFNYYLVLDIQNNESIESLELSNNSAVEIQNTIDNIEIKANKNIVKYHVEIKGEVKNPNVYSVTEDNIINDVIKMAGGFSSQAYKDNINLSMHIKDEMIIYVYSISEYADTKNTIVKYVPQEICECPTYDISECIELKESVIIPDNKTDEITDSKININTSDSEQLTTLSGIGESKANNIILYREKSGPFKSIEDIMNVSGISESTFEKIKDNITV